MSSASPSQPGLQRGDAVRCLSEHLLEDVRSHKPGDIACAADILPVDEYVGHYAAAGLLGEVYLECGKAPMRSMLVELGRGEIGHRGATARDLGLRVWQYGQ